MIHVGHSVYYGLSRSEVMELPYSEAMKMVSFLSEQWEKQNRDLEKAKRGR